MYLYRAHHDQDYDDDGGVKVTPFKVKKIGAFVIGAILTLLLSPIIIPIWIYRLIVYQCLGWHSTMVQPDVTPDLYKWIWMRTKKTV